MKNMKKSTIFKIIFLIIGIFFLIKNIGKPMILPYPFEMKFDNIHSASFIDDDSALIIDKQISRISILEDGRVIKINELKKNDILDKATTVVNDGKYYYVMGIKHRKDSFIIDKDLIVRYDKDGTNPKIIYEVKNEKDDDVLPNLNEFARTNNYFYVTKYKPLYNEANDFGVEIIRLNISDGELISDEVIGESNVDHLYSASYNEFNNDIYSVDYMGNAFVNDIKVNDTNDINIKSIVCDNEGNYYYVDEEDLLLFNNDEVLFKDILLNDVTIENDKLKFDNINDKKYYIYDLKTKELKSIESAPYSLFIYLDALITYLTIFAIIFMIIKAIIIGLINAYKNNNEQYIERFFVVLSGLIIVIFLTGFFTNQMIQNNIDNENEEIRVEAEYFSKIFDKNATYLDYQTFFKNYIRISRKYNEMEAINVYLYDDEGDLDMVYSTNNIYQAGSDMQRELKIDEPGLDVYSDSLIKIYYKTVKIKNENDDIAGYVVVQQDYKGTNDRIKDMIISTFMALLTLASTLYLIFKEGKEFIHGLIKNRIDKINNSVSKINFYHTIGFIYQLIPNITSVIFVLIIRDLCIKANYNEEITPQLVAISLMLSPLGYCVGALLYNFVAKMMRCKTLMTFSAILISILMFLSYYSYIAGDFVLFNVFIFIACIFLGIQDCAMNTIAGYNSDEKTEFANINDISSGKSAGVILGALICGFIADRFGNGVIFFLCGIIGIISIIIGLIALPDNFDLVEKTSGTKENFFTLIKKSFNLSFLAVAVLLYFSIEMIGGYKSYLFTLRADSLNISKIYISNIFAITKVLIKTAGRPLKTYLKQFEMWKIVIYEILIAGIIFMTFIINDTIYWFIIALIILSFISSHASSMGSILWDRQVDSVGLDQKKLASTEILVSKFYDIIMPAFISFILIYGYKTTYFTMSMVAIVFIILFALFTYRTSVAGENTVSHNIRANIEDNIK